jgi:hypothetical protein
MMEPILVKKIPSTIELLREALAIFQGQYRTILGIGFFMYIFLIILVLIDLINLPMEGGEPAFRNMTLAILSFGLTIASIFPMVWGVAAILCATPLGSETRLNAFTAFSHSRKHFWNLLWTFVLMWILIVLALLAFIIPAIILAFYWSLAPYVVVFEGLSGWAALRRSFQLILHNFWALVLRQSLFALLSFLILVPGFAVVELIDFATKSFLVGSIFSFFILILWYPISLLFNFAIYRSLASKRSDEEITPVKLAS